MTTVSDLIKKFQVKTHIFRGALDINLGKINFDNYDKYYDPITGYNIHYFNSNTNPTIKLRIHDYRLAVILTKRIYGEEYGIIWTPHKKVGYIEKNNHHPKILSIKNLE